MATDIRYVKFQRGTPEAFSKLTTPNSDTLYFISERNGNDGKLYLGSKLIAGSTLEDLSNLEINTEELEDNFILSYDEESKKWIASSLDEVIRSSKIIRVMSPATATKDGLAGYVPQPLAGDENKFLNGAGHWVSVGAGTATLQHSLTIGNVVFDGSKDVKIDAYDGSVIIE